MKTIAAILAFAAFQPTPIGATPEYQPPARWPLAGQPGSAGSAATSRRARGCTSSCSPTSRWSSCPAASASRAAGRRCTATRRRALARSAWSVEPGGVIHLAREGLTLGDVFRIWGADLAPTACSRSRADPGVGQRRAARRQPRRHRAQRPRSGRPGPRRGRRDPSLVRLQARPAITASMAQRTRPPFRADHVGSLLRPDRLRDARAAFKAGQATAEELERSRTTRSAR